MPRRKILVTVYLEPHHHARLRRLASREQRSAAALVREALDQFLDVREPVRAQDWKDARRKNPQNDHL